MTAPRFIEFFAGVGLVRLGLAAAGWRCVFANDRDAVKAEIYRRNFGGDELRVDDIANLAPRQLPDAELATASFPCTDLSLAGKRKGLAGSESGAFFDFVRLLRGMKRRAPRAVMLENVPGLLSSHAGRDIEQVIASLNEAGYACDMLMLDARWFAPQSRRRLFIVGVRGARGEPRPNQFAARSQRLKPPAIERAAGALRHLHWRFLPIPDPPPPSALALADVVERRNIARWWEPARVEELLDSMSPRHRAMVESLACDGAAPRYRAVFRRMRGGVMRAEVRKDEISGCLRPPRGGSSKQFLLSMEHGSIRARTFTAREYARIQGVADNFVLPPRENQGLFAIGDAVCVPAITWLAENVLNPLLRSG